jgi:hypothetical protein
MYRFCVGSNVKLLGYNSKFRTVAMFTIVDLQFYYTQCISMHII